MHCRPTNPRLAARSRPWISRLAATALVCPILTAPLPAYAQDFMFGRPEAWLKLQGGMNFASAGSDIFDDMTTRFTLDKSDFNAPGVAAEIGVPFGDRVALVLTGRYSASAAKSEYVDYVEYVGQDSLPIVQETRFAMAPITAGLRFNLIRAGRSISEFAWIPAPFVPYIGAAAGATWYRFRQEGDFVGESDPNLPIESDRFGSSGWTGTAQVFAGADFTLSRSLALDAEARYAVASANLDPFSYDGYEPIDLSGFWASVGLLVRF